MFRWNRPAVSNGKAPLLDKEIQNSLAVCPWAVAVGRRTKLAQKQKNIAHTQDAKKTLPKAGAKIKVEYNTAIATVMIIMHIL